MAFKDPLDKITVFISALAVIITMFSLVFVHGGEIGLPGGGEGTRHDRSGDGRGIRKKAERKLFGDVFQPEK